MIRILLAEDDDAMRTYLARALTNAGYDVVSVDRGTAAVPFLQQERFDLLLSDIVMPEMDGIELAQRCAEIAPETKVMFITGFAAVTLKASCEAPQAKVLSKPFHLRDLVLEVQRISAIPSKRVFDFKAACHTAKAPLKACPCPAAPLAGVLVMDWGV